MSPQSAPVAPSTTLVSGSAFAELIGGPLRRVLSDFSRDLLWRQLHSGTSYVDGASVVNASAVLSAPPEVPSLMPTLKASAVPSWDSLLSHLQRWRPSCLRPFNTDTRKHVLILQRLPQAQSLPSPAASLRAISVDEDEPGGLLPELARLQAGANPYLPDFVALLSRPDDAPASPLTLSVVRRRAEDLSNAFSKEELEELDDVVRCLGIFLWMLRRSEK